MWRISDMWRILDFLLYMSKFMTKVLHLKMKLRPCVHKVPQTLTMLLRQNEKHLKTRVQFKCNKNVDQLFRQEKLE